MVVPPTPHQSSAKIENNCTGVWDKSWVRPFESLWSIINNYKAVNVIKEHATALKALGFRITGTVTTKYLSDYGIFCNLSQAQNDIDDIISRFVPVWYIAQVREWASKPGISFFLSEMIHYCPECMKNGYHSIFHQLKGLEKCPFHPNIYLISYMDQRYVIGKQSKYAATEKNGNKLRSRAFWGREFSYNHINFEQISALPLPPDWNAMPEIELYLHAHKPRTDFNYVQPIGADIHDINIIPAIGDFLLQDKVALKPDIIIYNIDESDQLIMDKIKKRAESYGIMQEYVPKYTYKQRFKYIFLQIVIVEMLYQFTNDEIEYKSYQIEKGKAISCEDELGKRLLYLLLLTGNENIEECFRNIVETKSITEQFGLNYYLSSSDICIYNLEVDNLCISAQYYILDEYIRINWKNFQNNMYCLGKIHKPLHNKDLILHPQHLIYEECNNEVHIYRYN